MDNNIFQKYVMHKVHQTFHNYTQYVVQRHYSETYQIFQRLSDDGIIPNSIKHIKTMTEQPLIQLITDKTK